MTDDGYRIGTLFKSSKIGKDVGYKALQMYHAKSKEKLKEPGALDYLCHMVKAAMSPYNTWDEFRQQTQSGWYQPRGRIYGVTFVDHANGIVSNGSVLGKELSAHVFNELFLASEKEEQHTVGRYAERKHESQNHTANPVLGIVDTLLDLADVWAFEEDASHARSGHSLLGDAAT